MQASKRFKHADFRRDARPTHFRYRHFTTLLATALYATTQTIILLVSLPAFFCYFTPPRYIFIYLYIGATPDTCYDFVSYLRHENATLSRFHGFSRHFSHYAKILEVPYPAT
jgi:hypothetical protein